MKITLKEFQDEAVADLVEKAAEASRARRKSGEAIILSAPTGSGKTVIATALMEAIVNGSGEHAANPEARFLWFSDSPSLNEQSRSKILATSSTFTDDDLVTVEAETFHQETFEAGHVYFVNTQKLGEGSNLTKHGDERSITIWETIDNTIKAAPGDFYLIIDEAHRGMGAKASASDAPASIVKHLLEGSDVVSAVPLVIGISATPERFDKYMPDTGRSITRCTVDPTDVRDSGLLKETILLYHPDDNQHGDMSMLASAVAKLGSYRTAWESEAANDANVSVRPMLVIQVADKISADEIGEIVRTIEEALGEKLSSDDIAHCFDGNGSGGTDLDVNGFTIPYMRPSDIEASDARVVLFKMALTTGWDCPRAEVMMSFRGAKDGTLIAQLVGRMVRTPLSRRVEDNDELNSVSLFLPHYQPDEVAAVIKRLSDADPDNGLPGTTVVSRPVSYVRDASLADVFAHLETLPTYSVARASRMNGVRRALAVGRALTRDKIDAGASAAMTKALLDSLDKAMATARKDKGFAKKIKDAGVLDMGVKTVVLGDDEATDEARESVSILGDDIERSFEDAGRVLGGGGLHTLYLRRRARAEGADKVSLIKRELFVLTRDEAIAAAMQADADTLAAKALAANKSDIDALTDADRKEHYRQLRRRQGAPLEETLDLPASIIGSRSGTELAKHVYIGERGGKFRCDLNPTLELPVIQAEIARDDVVGWLRNEDRKPWALCVPYERNGEYQRFFPDFIVSRETKSGATICDILEPHSLAFSDGVAKVKGLAVFARDHGDRFGRILFLAPGPSGTVASIDLNDDETRKKALALEGEQGLKTLLGL